MEIPRAPVHLKNFAKPNTVVRVYAAGTYNVISGM